MIFVVSVCLIDTVKRNQCQWTMNNEQWNNNCLLIVDSFRFVWFSFRLYFVCYCLSNHISFYPSFICFVFYFNSFYLCIIWFCIIQSFLNHLFTARMPKHINHHISESELKVSITIASKFDLMRAISNFFSTRIGF